MIGIDITDIDAYDLHEQQISELLSDYFWYFWRNGSADCYMLKVSSLVPKTTLTMIRLLV